MYKTKFDWTMVCTVKCASGVEGYPFRSLCFVHFMFEDKIKQNTQTENENKGGGGGSYSLKDCITVS